MSLPPHLTERSTGWRGVRVAVRPRAAVLFDDDAGEVWPQTQIEVWKPPRERAYVRFVELDEPSSDVFLHVGRVRRGVHPFRDAFVDERLQFEKAVRPCELGARIGHALLILQYQDLLLREVRGPLAQLIVIKAPCDGVPVRLSRQSPAVTALVGEPRAESFHGIAQHDQQAGARGGLGQ